MDAEKVVKEIGNYARKDDSKSNYTAGFNSGLFRAIRIIESHQDDKVVWPKYVAVDWEHRLHAENGNFGFALESMLDGECTSGKTNTWLFNDGNLKTFLEGILHGYTVEKQKKYRVKVSDCLYFDHWENAQAAFGIDSQPGFIDEVKTFTKEDAEKIVEQLKAGELEGVEDD